MTRVFELRLPATTLSGDARLTEWKVNNGDLVEQDQYLYDIEDDKAMFEMPASESGRIEIIMPAGSEVKCGDLLARIHST